MDGARAFGIDHRDLIRGTAPNGTRAWSFFSAEPLFEASQKNGGDKSERLLIGDHRNAAK
jgi:hypothetical protein